MKYRGLEYPLGDPELAAIVSAWPSLPTPIRDRINGLIRVSGDQQE
ncbi:hypothetical protein OAK32_01425 [Mariniblastus sp.]|nr:hypothetical protein [Mariniblastus sp.]